MKKSFCPMGEGQGKTGQVPKQVSGLTLTVMVGLSAPGKLKEQAFPSRWGNCKAPNSLLHIPNTLIYSDQNYDPDATHRKLSLHNSGFSFSAASWLWVQKVPPVHSEATLIISSQDIFTFVGYSVPPEYCLFKPS